MTRFSFAIRRIIEFGLFPLCLAELWEPTPCQYESKRRHAPTSTQGPKEFQACTGSSW